MKEIKKERMKKRMKLLDFARTVPLKYDGKRGSSSLFAAHKIFQDASGRSVDIATYTDNVTFEQFVIDDACNTAAGWRRGNFCAILLKEYFLSRNDLEGKEYYYNKIVDFCRNRGLCQELVYDYAKNVLRGRYSKVYEEKFMPILWNDYLGERAAYKYCKYVVKGRIEKESEVNCNSLRYLEFIKSKGLEFEDLLMSNSYLSALFYRKYNYLPNDVHNMMIAQHLIGNRAAKSYFKMRKSDDTVLKRRLGILDPNKTVREVLEDM
jgi:hypothetical protein